jgi:hypothetical protein
MRVCCKRLYHFSVCHPVFPQDRLHDRGDFSVTDFWVRSLEDEPGLSAFLCRSPITEKYGGN